MGDIDRERLNKLKRPEPAELVPIPSGRTGPEAPEWWEDITGWVSPWAEKAMPKVAPVLGVIGKGLEAWEQGAQGPYGRAILGGVDPRPILTPLLRGAELGWQLLGLAASPILPAYPPYLMKPAPMGEPRTFEGPRIEKYPAAAKAFWGGLTEEGDIGTRVERAIEDAQDAAEAGWGHWFASEMIAGALAPYLAARAGAGLVKAATPLARTLADPITKVAPRAAPSIERGIEAGARGTGGLLQVPWELEEAIGRGIAKGVGWAAGPVARPLISRFRRPGVEVAEEAPRMLGAPDVPTPTTALVPAVPGAPKVIPPGLPQLQDIGEAIDIATRVNLGRRIANWPLIKNIQKRFNPSAVRNTVEGRGLTGLAILKFEAGQKASQSMAALRTLGTQERAFGKLDSQGLFAEGNLKGLAPNDVRTNWEQPYISQRLTDPQKKWIRAAQDIEEAKLVFLRANGIAIKELTFEQGGHYAGRRLMGQFDSSGNLVDWRYVGKQTIKGRKLAQEKKRFFRTQKEGIDLGFEYIPEDEALSMNVQSAYNRVAEKKFAAWLLENSPTIRVLGKGLRPRKGEVSAALGRMIPDLSGVVFKGPKADETVALLRQELVPMIGEIDKLLSGVAKVNAVGRFMQLNADASPFLIQLLYMTGARGGLKAWGKGIEGFARTLFNTRYHARLIANNSELWARHRALLTSQSGTEYTEAVQRGGLLMKGPKLAPWRLVAKAFDPFARAFNAAMDDAGIQLAKSMDAALKPKTAAEYADIDAFINEIRGLASTVRLGQSARWRAIESNLLLAPRYNRSIAALLWDTVADGGIRGNEARWALGKSLTGLTLIGAAFSIAEYLRETDEPTQEGMVSAVVAHINPTSPTFFTWKVGNSNVGPGTKVRSLIKLAAESVTDPRSLLEQGMDNPATRFARGNLAPVLSDAWDVFSGYTYIGDPTGFFDGWDDESVGENFSKLGTEVILPDLMPIWTQAVLLEGGTLVERFVRGAVEFAGGRAYPLSRTQLAEGIAQAQFGKNYDDLDNNVKPIVDKLVVRELGERAYRGPKGRLYKEIDDIDATFLEAIQKASDTHLSQEPYHKDFSPISAKVEFQRAATAHRGAKYGTQYRPKKGRIVGGVYETLYDRDEEREEPDLGTKEHLLWRYYNIIPNATKKDGTIDWDEFERLTSEFWASLKDDQEVEMVLANIRVIEAEYPEPIQTMVDAGRYAGAVKVYGLSYWDIEKLDEVRQDIANKAGATKSQVDAYMDALNSRRREEMRASDVYKEIDDVLRKERLAETGVLGSIKIEWMDAAPLEWFLAMQLASYEFLIDEDIRDELKDSGEWNTIMQQPYGRLHRDALKANR